MPDGKDPANSVRDEEAGTTPTSTELLPLQHDEHADDETDGLELDERQSDEIRRIFATTLPQYLIPVEEMIEQLLSGSAGPDVAQALVGTISSLQAAAARMGFAEVEQHLDKLAAHVDCLRPGQVDRAAREEVLGELLDLKDVAATIGGEATPAESSPSLVRALSEQDGSGATILDRLGSDGVGLVSRLSAAGLVTVDQLLAGRPAEVAAVSGLTVEAVERLVRMIVERAEEGEGVEPVEPVLPDAEPQPPAVAAPASNLIVLPGDPLRRELVRKLGEQVEAEASLDELRVDVHRLRGRISLERRQIQEAGESCRALETSMRRVGEQLARDGGTIAQLRDERALLERKAAEASALLRNREQRVVELRRERQKISDADSSMGEELQALVDQVGGLLRQVAGGVPAEPRAPGRKSE